MKHYRPPASTREEKKEFLEASRRMAKFIRNGGLRYEPVESYMQVHRSSWEPLEKINLSGILTFDSQDAICAVSGKTKPWKRSYISGFMLPAEALTFVNNINIWNDDKVALICFEPLDSDIPIHAEIAVTCMFDNTSGTWFGANVVDAFMNKDQRDFLNEQYKIPEDLRLYAVQVFDTKWGRSATSRNGLWNSVLRALDSNVRYPKSLRPARAVNL